jgi:predicted dehydrogenase
MEVLCERAFYVLEGDVWGPVRWTTPEGDGAVEGEALGRALNDLGVTARNPDVAFIAAVAAGGPAYPGFEVALRPHALADAIYESAAAGGAAVTPAAVTA